MNWFEPDYDAYPKARNASCYDDTVVAGEAVFYPRDYWHQTRNAETPTIAISSTIVDANNYDSVTEELSKECNSGARTRIITPSRELCAALEVCVPLFLIRCHPASRSLYAHPTRGARRRQRRPGVSPCGDAGSEDETASCPVYT